MYNVSGDSPVCIGSYKCNYHTITAMTAPEGIIILPYHMTREVYKSIFISGNIDY